MSLKQLRIQKGWSQEALSEKSNISVRTLQRIENGKTANLTTLKALADALEVEVMQLTQPDTPSYNWSKSQKAFISHLIYFVVVMFSLAVINTTSEQNHSWVWWVFLGWGLYLIFEGLEVFSVFNALDSDEQNE
ncbi:MAG: helix-turn-helix domain-containing protein [Pseudomonadota bacterium]